MISKKNLVILGVAVLSYASIFLLNLVSSAAKPDIKPTVAVTETMPEEIVQNTTTKSKELKPIDYNDNTIISVNNITVYTDDSVKKNCLDNYCTLINQIENPYNGKICFIKLSNKPLNTYTPAALGASCYYDDSTCTLYIYSDKYSSEEFYYCVGEALDRHNVYSKPTTWGLLSKQLTNDYPDKSKHELFATAVMLYYTDYDNLTSYKGIYDYISPIISSERSKTI